MMNTNTINVLRNLEIVPAFGIENSLVMLSLLLRKASIHRSAVDSRVNGGGCHHTGSYHSWNCHWPVWQSDPILELSESHSYKELAVITCLIVMKTAAESGSSRHQSGYRRLCLLYVCLSWLRHLL